MGGGYSSGSTLGLPKGLPSDSITDLTNYLDVGEPGISGPTGNIDGGDRALTRWINKELVRAEPHVMAWREQARDCYRFRDGHQLSTEDAQILKAQKRPNTAFNEIQKFLRFISGIERHTQQALLFLPRNVEDQEAQIRGEWKTKLYDWFMAESKGQYARSRAFEDKLVGGLGFVDIGVSKVVNPHGLPRYCRIDPMQMLWPECLSADTAVRLPPVKNAYRRSYSGELIHVALENGKTLTGTPNHPMLTNRGWKGLGMLDPTDELVDGSLIERLPVAPNYFENVESRLEQRVDTFSVTEGAATGRTYQGLPNQFHGDGAGSEVYTVFTNSHLGRQFFWKEFIKQLQELSFAASVHVGIGSYLETFQASLYGVMIEASLPRDFAHTQSLLMKFNQALRIHFPKEFRVIGAVAAWRAARKTQSYINQGLIGPSESISDFSGREALRVIKTADFVSMFDRYGVSATELPVVHISSVARTFVHDFPVFNLTTECGTFIAQGIITSNCDAENLVGCRWMGRENNMDVTEAIRKWPDYAIFLRAAAGGAANEDAFPDFGRGAGRPIQYVVPWIMTEPLNKNGGQSTGKPGKVPILEFQFYEDEAGYYFFDPLEKEDAWLNEKDYRKYKVNLARLYDAQITDFEPTEKRVYKRTFLLQRRIMLEDPRPLPTNGEHPSFTWNPMTGIWDPDDKCFYGFTRVVMDPQRFANAMSRQILELMGAATKGGYLAETGSITVAQKRDFEESGSRPGSINMVQPDALRTGRITPKAIPQVPAGTLAVWQAALEQIEKVAGISTQMMGAGQVGQTPGISLRKQLLAGMMLLAPDFDSLSMFRIQEGYIVSDFLKLIADDRLVRIGGAFDAQSIQLKKSIFDEYDDIILDESDQDPNQRQLYTDSILQIAPMLIRTGNFFPELLDYLNLPVQIRQRLKQGMQQAEQQKAQMAQQGLSVGGRGKPRSLEEIQAQVGLTKARTAEHVAKAGMYQSQAGEMGARAQSTTKAIRRDDMKAIMDTLLNFHKAKKEENARRAEYLLKSFDTMGNLVGTFGGLANDRLKARNGNGGGE